MSAKQRETGRNGEEAMCPACGRAQSTGAGFIAFCRECGHRWLNSNAADHHAREMTIYSSEYSGYVPDTRFAAFVRGFVANELAARLPKGARILDVGCGAGEFMAEAQAQGFAVEGIDVSEASEKICRSRGLEARAGDFLTAKFDGKFDLITMWDVVEHLLDPGAFFDRSRELLADNGMLFAKIPMFGDLSVRLSSTFPRAAGALLGAPSHVQFFDKESLGRLVSAKGFEAEWLPSQAIRTKTTGGSLKRKAARKVKAVVAALAGDSNAFLLAKPIRHAA